MAAEKTKLNVAQFLYTIEIPTAIPMFSRSGDTAKLLRRLSDVRIKEKSKMAVINQKLM